jgi:beta-lactamase regulating signal transducer with metallopeptidase domain
MSLLATLTLDVTIVIAIALAATMILRRQSAALRHWVLASALACAAAMPLFEATLPSWRLPLPAWLTPASTSTLTSGPAELTTLAAQPLAASPESGGFRPAPETLALGVWAAGAAAGLITLLAGLVRLASLRRRATRVQAEGLPRSVRLLRSGHPSLIMTWGVWRPNVLLPATSDSWTSERLRIVLAHELAHVRRGDWAVQIVASLVQCVYWFNPLVWIACRRLRLESERACDDAVLGAGVAGPDYAAHLLDVARDAVRLRNRWLPASAIAHPSTLEGRIRAMLNVRLNRTPLGAFATYATVILLGALSVAVSTAAVSAASAAIAADVVLATPQQDRVVVREVVVAPTPVRPAPARPVRPAAAAAAQQGPASLTGVLRDPSGGVLPGVQMTLTGASGSRSATTDGSGRYGFRDLAPGRYTLTALLPGFSTATMQLTVTAGANVERNVELRVGGLMETITVTCASGGASLGGGLSGVMAAAVRAWVPTLFAQAPPATPVRVGGQIRAPRMLKTVNPTCPAPPAADTVVILEATIGADGMVRDVRNLRQSVPTAYVEAATAAVQQWQYTPTLLNNVAVPVIMTVTVQFTRS